jgi:F-type H+-transporting ATPase subunit b
VLIDWYTVGAQVLNFLILVWLMKHFLYKPVLGAIDTRERLIATELADAAAKKAEAHKERDEFEHRNEELDRQRAALLKKAKDDVDAERQRLLDQARRAADALSAQRQAALRNDVDSLHEAIQHRTQHEVFAIARKALTDLATTSLEERLAAVFTRRLRELDGATKACLATGLAAASNSALVRSAFELPADQRAVIQNALNETFSADLRVQFEIAPDLVSGIELATNGQKVGWTISEYLRSLEQGVDELLKEREKAEVKTELTPETRSKGTYVEAASKPEGPPGLTLETEAEPTSQLAPEPAGGVALPGAMVAFSPEPKAPTAEVISVPTLEQPHHEAKSQ